MLSLLLPSQCAICGDAGPSPCGACWGLLEPAPPLPPPPGLDSCRSLLRYEGAGRELIARLKFGNQRAAVPWVAAGMASLVASRGAEVDAVTWAPTSRARRRERGFDQAEVLARAVAAHVRRPVHSLLVRTSVQPQTGLDRTQRGVGPAFSVAGRPVPSSVLVVDDVVTTGATLAAAASVLRRAGASAVVAVTAARTPLKLSVVEVDR